jgi:hypothetical protein
MQNTLMATLNPSDIIMGTILELTEEELLLADKYEPSNYFRQPVVLASGKTAWVYLAL